MRTLWSIFQKDLRIEGRARELFPAMAILTLLLLATGSAAGLARPMVPALLWLSLLIAIAVGLGRSFHQETDQDQIQGLIMAPIDPALIYLGKALANLVVVLWVEVVTVGASTIFFNLDPGPSAASLAVILVLGTIGVVSLGTLLAAMLATARLREALLPLLLLPLSVPAVVAAVGATGKVLAGQPLSAAAGELQLLAAFAVLFAAGPVLIFEFVIEE